MGYDQISTSMAFFYEGSTLPIAVYRYTQDTRWAGQVAAIPLHRSLDYHSEVLDQSYESAIGTISIEGRERPSSVFPHAIHAREILTGVDAWSW